MRERLKVVGKPRTMARMKWRKEDPDQRSLVLSKGTEEGESDRQSILMRLRLPLVLRLGLDATQCTLLTKVHENELPIY